MPIDPGSRMARTTRMSQKERRKRRKIRRKNRRLLRLSPLNAELLMETKIQRLGCTVIVLMLGNQRCDPLDCLYLTRRTKSTDRDCERVHKFITFTRTVCLRRFEPGSVCMLAGKANALPPGCNGSRKNLYSCLYPLCNKQTNKS